MNKIHIAGAIASKSGITLYLEDGSEMSLPKNSHRTNEIMQKIAKPLARKEIVEIDLDAFSMHVAIERKTGGVIRFIRDKVSNFLNFKGVTGGLIGMTTLSDDETVVAVVNGKKIPGMAALDRQIEHAAFSKDCKGFVLFMERLATVIDDRGHSVQELLNFMRHADLPIADDGTIIAYKTLNYQNGQDGDVFKDCHSGVVMQKLGSRVSMPLASVDPSRREQCSTGLHIARRQYISGYYGDLLTLVKVAPEDIVAVPHGEPAKMRAAAYHIVAVLGEDAFDLIKGQKPMTTNATAARLLASVIAGDHVPVLEEVRIGELKDSGHYHDKDIDVEPTEDVKPFSGAGDNGMAAALDDSQAVNVDIRDLNKKIKEVVAEKPKPKKRKAVDPTVKTAQQRRKDACNAVAKGMSQREAAKKFKVCPKTLRKMLKNIE